MIAATLLLASLAQATPPAPPPAPAARAESPIVISALASERRFLDQWQTAWINSENARFKKFYELSAEGFARAFPKGPNCTSVLFRCGKDGPKFIKPGGVNEPRAADRTCDFFYESVPMYVPDQAWGLPPEKRKIASHANDRHWVCPNWLQPPDYYLSGPRLPDERINIDGALDRDYQSNIARQRYGLILEMNNAVRDAPPSNLLAGQLVRLLVDANSMNSALAAARECKADASWCRALLGYVYHRRGEIFAADQAFTESMKLASPADRCRYTNVGMLLNDARAYTNTQCEARDSLNAVLWWLADPLWSVPGNDRRTEQFSRRVVIDLHAALGRDERYNWTAMGGGDALAEMIARYGWMSYTSRSDSALSIKLPPPKPPDWGVPLLYQPRPSGPPLPDPVEQARALGGVRTTFEYSIGRLHTVPTADMMADPFSIKQSDWSLNAPGGEYMVTMAWWPQEHFAPLHPLVDISDQQVAFLRRDRTVLLAYATDFRNTDLARKIGDSVRTVLIVSSGPQDAEPVAQRTIGAADRVSFLTPIPPAPSVVSMEVPWDNAGHRGARARFGVRPPPPLSAMQGGALAISDPVILVVPRNTTELPIAADGAIALMRGSTTLDPGTKSIGVYWETYGFSATDSVEVTVSVQRRAGGLLERIGAATGITGDANAQVTASWKEPDPGHTTRSLGGTVPVQMRSVVLDIASLPPGTYTLGVSVAKTGASAVNSSREFVIRP